MLQVSHFSCKIRRLRAVKVVARVNRGGSNFVVNQDQLCMLLYCILDPTLHLCLANVAIDLVNIKLCEVQIILRIVPALTDRWLW